MARAKTDQLKTPSKPGAPFAGGFYVGRFFIDNEAYALIVSPKASGQTAPMKWNASPKNVAGANSYCDGLANTKAMVKSGSDLAKHIAGLEIGGFKDWYLPSRLELLLASYELATVKQFTKEKKEAFAPYWYWSSTQPAEDADYAWVQGFGSGYQVCSRKGGEFRARAVRRIKL